MSARALSRQSPKNRRQLVKHRGRDKRLQGRYRLPVLAGVWCLCWVSASVRPLEALLLMSRLRTHTAAKLSQLGPQRQGRQPNKPPPVASWGALVPQSAPTKTNCANCWAYREQQRIQTAPPALKGGIWARPDPAPPHAP